MLFAVVAIMMVSCADTEKDTKLYNCNPKDPEIASIYQPVNTPWGMRYSIVGVNTTSINENAVYLRSYTRQHAGAGEWDQSEVLFSASGYDSLSVEFYSSTDEKIYRQGGEIFYGPHTITMWFHGIIIEVSAQ